MREWCPLSCFRLLVAACCCVFACACGVSRLATSHKIAPDLLRRDLDVLWETYRKVHPSYDWYTAADSVNHRFARVRAGITDSLTEPEFRLRLAWATAAIRCGHTSLLPSKAYAGRSESRIPGAFPLQVRIWGKDSMVVTENTGSARDTIYRGVMIHRIDSVPVSELIRQMSEYVSSDGSQDTYAAALLSSGFAFRFRWMYGAKPSYLIEYTDTFGRRGAVRVKSVQPARTDSLQGSRPQARQSGLSRAKQPPPFFIRSDSANEYLYLRLNRFSGPGFRHGLRWVFRSLAQHPTTALVLDVRANGGGKISKSVWLARHLASSPFRMADSVSAVTLRLPYPRYVQGGRWFAWLRPLFTTARPDGRLHLGIMEKKWIQPRRSRHFSGSLYLLTGGRSFSATTLLLNYLTGRGNTWMIGEETGGTARGNSSVLLPQLTLPHSRIRATLPLFRIVTRQALPADGRGIVPHILVDPSALAIRRKSDAVLDTAILMIREKQPVSGGRQ